MIGLRIFTNINVLWLFATSVYAVVFVVQRSTEKREAGGWWRQNEVTIVVSLITNLYPFIFEMLGSLEQYHPRKRLRMQLARIMVLNLLNLYTFILASFSKINDMTIKLQEIKRILINTSTSPPAELILPDKHGIVIPATTAVYTNVFYDIFNLTPSSASTVSPCYVEKVNCSTKITTDDLFMTTSSPPTVTASSPSSKFSTLTTLFLLSTTISNFSADTHNNETIFNHNNYNTNIYSENSSLYDKVIDYIDYGSADVKDGLNNQPMNSKRNVKNLSNVNQETKHFILPVNVELFNFRNNSDDYYLTAEDYEDQNFTDLGLIIPKKEDDENLTTTINDTDVGDLTETTTVVLTTTDDGCQEITICPDIISSTDPSYSTEPSFYSEITETPVASPTTAFAITGNEITRDLSLHTKNLDVEMRRKLRSLCWETMFGQELVKLTVMDLVLTILSTLMVDFIRAVFVRVMNNCWCWDLEKKFPQYGDFKIAENILHLVNNQGMVWMGMFFSPGLPLINLIKLAVMMYLRSWAVLTCNVPHEVVFRASRSNNFYLALLLTMLFLCVLPVSYAIVWVEPSWHCGPFSNYEKIYHLFTNSTKKAIPSKVVHRALDYIASPGIVIPLLMLLVLIIYYLISLTNALREANNDLKIQLRRERTEERRKVFQMVDRKHRGGGGDLIDSTPFHNWQKTLTVLPNTKVADDLTSDAFKEEMEQNANGDIKTDAKKLLSKFTKRTTHRHSDEECAPIIDADGTDIEQADSLPDDQLVKQHHILHEHRLSIHQQSSVTPEAVLKTNTHHKKHHEGTVVIHHKHNEIKKHDRRDVVHEKLGKSDRINDNGDFYNKDEKHDAKDKYHEIVRHKKSENYEKHDKHDLPKKKEVKKHKELTTKYERKDSIVSIHSDNIIPEILISQTDSTDDSQDNVKFEEPSKSSSADTIIAIDMTGKSDDIIAEDGHKKRKQKVSYKITKQIAEQELDTDDKIIHTKKHHKPTKRDLKEDQHKSNMMSGVLLEIKHPHDKSDLKKEFSDSFTLASKSIHKDKHALLQQGKEKNTVIEKILPKDLKIKAEGGKNNENIVKRHHHEGTSPHKDRKVNPDHSHKQKDDKKETQQEHTSTHKQYVTRDGIDKHKKHHFSHELEKSTKIHKKGRENVSDESEEEIIKVTTKKKPYVLDEKKLHATVSESSSKEDYSVKLKPKHKHNVEDTSHHSSTFSTDDSSKSSKKLKKDKESEHKEKHIHMIEYKEIDETVHRQVPSSRKRITKHKDYHEPQKQKIHYHEKKYKDNSDNETKSHLDAAASEIELDESCIMDHHVKHKKRTERKINNKKYIKKEKDKTHKYDKILLPETSSDYDETNERLHEKMSENGKKRVGKEKLSSDQSVSDEENKEDFKKRIPDKYDKNNFDQESIDDMDDGKEDSDNNDLSICNDGNDHQRYKRENDGEEIKFSVKDSPIKQKLVDKLKKVTLVETESKQSSSDTSTQSQSQSVKSANNDNDNERSQSDILSNEHSNKYSNEKSSNAK